MRWLQRCSGRGATVESEVMDLVLRWQRERIEFLTKENDRIRNDMRHHMKVELEVLRLREKLKEG